MYGQRPDCRYQEWCSIRILSSVKLQQLSMEIYNCTCICCCPPITLMCWHHERGNAHDKPTETSVGDKPSALSTSRMTAAGAGVRTGVAEKKKPLPVLLYLLGCRRVRHMSVKQQHLLGGPFSRSLDTHPSIAFWN